MPSFLTGVVADVLSERTGLQRVHVDLGAGPERAYVLTQLTGPVRAGDRVVVNTTAVELGLGTGGWHVVHWNLARDSFSSSQPGHVMKLRYTSLQVDVGAADALAGDDTDLGGMPVVVAGLHSQVAAVAVAFKHLRPDARVVYVMTDGGALPLAVSDLVFALREKRLLDATVTCGHAFGGDYEAVNIASALAIARHVTRADAVVVAMGPGGVGTGTSLGFSGLEMGAALDAAGALGGLPVAVLRVSDVDPRERHRGLSHHTRTALTIATHVRARIAIPQGLLVDGLDRHELVPAAPVGIVALMADAGLDVTSMGRPAADDPILFECAGAAGVLAAELLP